MVLGEEERKRWALLEEKLSDVKFEELIDLVATR